ncbi:MAG: DNA repair protein RecO [Elusimicrobiota bacterium]|jgi:DNA repair protein RecO (recombination protein O)|nr:DNA repair protein RecO [Elusimicrobiota bacterium]
MYYQIKGLVLNSKTEGEADKVSAIYSLEWGKISAIAPGAKKIKAKLNAATEPLTESEFMVYQSAPSMRPRITGARVINSNVSLKTDFQKTIYALYAAEICDKMLPYNIQNEKKYSLITRIWEILDNTHFPRRAIAAFTLRFLTLSGYAFSDYIKQGNLSIDRDLQKSIYELSTCRGSRIDELVIDDGKVCRLVESYLLNYAPEPKCRIFLEKISKFKSNVFAEL